MHFKSISHLQDRCPGINIVGGLDGLREHDECFALVSMIHYTKQQELIDFTKPPRDEILEKLLANRKLVIVKTTNGTIPSLPGYITFPMYIGGEKEHINYDMLFTAIISKEQYLKDASPAPSPILMSSKHVAKPVVISCMHSIEGLDKAKLLLSLYDNANCQGEAYTDETQRAMSLLLTSQTSGKIKIAKQLIEGGQTDFSEINLGCGLRFIGVNLVGEEADFAKYEAQHGTGKAANVIGDLEAKPKPKSCTIC